MIGNLIYDYCRELFYINRSITGNGVRETLKSISKKVNNFQINEVSSGTKCFDWKVPKEWNVNDAFIADEKGNKIIDFKDNNIHLVGYSKAVDKVVPYNELMNKLYTIPEMPNVIPYITSYYSEDWGFCVTEKPKE